MATHFKSGLAIGTKGTAVELSLVIEGTVSVNPASIAANTTGDTSVTIASAKAGDIIVWTPPSDLEAGLVVGGSWCASDGTVVLRLGNVTVGAIDGAAKTWSYLIIRS